MPERCWDSSPDPGFAPLSKQFRHVVCVRGVYNDGLVSGRVDFSKKHEHYSGGLARDDLVAALTEKQEELLAILEDAARLEASDFAVDFFGRPETFAGYGYVMVQHEAIHHGQWSFYATLGGFETPPGWKLNWGL